MLNLEHYFPPMDLPNSISNFLKRQSGAWIFAEAIILVVAIGVIDYLTGYEISFFPFYSIPILLVMWFKGRDAAVVICVISALAWLCADIASGHVYSSEWYRVWDTIVRMIFFFLVVMAGAAFRHHRDANKARIELLERSRKLEQEIISISEREQQRIGRDLHDGLGQHLVAIGFAADSLKEYLKQGRGAAAAGQIADLVHDAVVRARHLSRGLSPVDQDEGAIESALERLAFSASKMMGVPCSFVSDGDINVPESNTAVHLFRIAQEAVNNAVKHSRARDIVIALDATEGALALRVSDNGIGFQPNGTIHRGMGLNIMQYRARMIGGVLEIQPNSPTGTVVSCTIPNSELIPKTDI